MHAQGVSSTAPAEAQLSVCICINLCIYTHRRTQKGIFDCHLPSSALPCPVSCPSLSCLPPLEEEDACAPLLLGPGMLLLPFQGKWCGQAGMPSTSQAFMERKKCPLPSSFSARHRNVGWRKRSAFLQSVSLGHVMALTALPGAVG